MKKNTIIYIIIAALLLIAIIAGSRTVWNKSTPGSTPTAVPGETQQQSPPSVATAGAGSVAAPNCLGVDIKGTTPASVCGVAVVTGKTDNTVIKAVQSARQADLLSMTITLYFTSGSADLCFAGQPNQKIYYSTPNTSTWTPLPTTVNGGKACVTVLSTGSYALGN